MAPQRTPYRRLTRGGDGRLLAGVAAGLADHLGLPVMVVRVGFALLAAAGGVGVLIYGALWAVVPQQPGTGRPSLIDRSQLIAFVVLAAAVSLLLGSAGLGVGSDVVAPLVLGGLGAALLWRQADDAQRARWTASARGPWRVVAGTDRRRGAARLGAGIALVLAGVAVFLLANHALAQARTGLLAVLATVVGLALVTGPWWIGMARGLTVERRARVREQERAEVAAHVHDSVLQTLTLIQRSADDSRAVHRLARAQERELRHWLYRPSLGEQRTLADALESAAAEVEEEYGVAVEVVAVGAGLPVDERLGALLAATREAVVNAAKSSGAEAVSVYAEVEDAPTGRCAQIFVRDRGKGFELDAVPPDRFGVRESIIGRMQRNGGRAVVVTAPGEGTEVRLAMPLATAPAAL